MKIVHLSSKRRKSSIKKGKEKLRGEFYLTKCGFVIQTSNKTIGKQEKCHKWSKNHERSEFYHSPNKSTVVDGSFIRY